MKKILVTKNNEPILDIVKDISAGQETDFGVYRVAYPDCDWDRIHQINLSMDGYTKTVEISDALKLVLLGDLAYVYGRNTMKFEQKIKEFELL